MIRRFVIVSILLAVGAGTQALADPSEDLAAIHSALGTKLLNLDDRIFEEHLREADEHCKNVKSENCKSRVINLRMTAIKMAFVTLNAELAKPEVAKPKAGARQLIWDHCMKSSLTSCLDTVNKMRPIQRSTANPSKPPPREVTRTRSTVSPAATTRFETVRARSRAFPTEIPKPLPKSTTDAVEPDAYE